MADDDGDTSNEQSAPQLPQEKLYTKAELDGQLAKERIKLRKEFADYAELKVAADEYNKLKEASKSTEERLRDEAMKATRERDEWRNRDLSNRMRVAVIAEAARQGATDPEDVAKLLDPSELVVTDDGVDGVKEAVELLLASKRYLVDGRRRGGSELRGVAGQVRSASQLTQSQVRAWIHGEDGGLTPERIKRIDEARKAGTIEADR